VRLLQITNVMMSKKDTCGYQCSRDLIDAECMPIIFILHLY